MTARRTRWETMTTMRKLAVLDCTLERVQRALSNDTDLTTRQIRAFLMVAKASIEGDPLTTEDLRRFLNLSSQTAQRTVAYFVEHGFIERQPSTFDCRAKLLILTDAGRAIANVLMEQSDEAIPPSKAQSAAH